MIGHMLLRFVQVAVFLVCNYAIFHLYVPYFLSVLVLPVSKVSNNLLVFIFSSLLNFFCYKFTDCFERKNLYPYVRKFFVLATVL